MRTDMLLPPQTSGRLTTADGAQIPYTTVGDGPIPVVLLLGVNDGLDTVDTVVTSIFLEWFYFKRTRRQRLLCLSRRQPIPPGYSPEQHAQDMLWAIEQMQWGPTALECISAGGPIGQWMAVKRPDLVRGLILSSTPHYTNEHTRDLSSYWIRLAQQGKWAALRWSLNYYTFKGTRKEMPLPYYVAQNFLASPFSRAFSLSPLFRLFLDPISTPRYPERFERLVAPLLYLDNTSILPRIACPTLVIGGEDDRVIDASVQREMAELIPNSQLKLYPGYGHGNSFENPEYSREVERFLQGLSI